MNVDLKTYELTKAVQETNKAKELKARFRAPKEPCVRCRAISAKMELQTRCGSEQPSPRDGVDEQALRGGYLESAA